MPRKVRSGAHTASADMPISVPGSLVPVRGDRVRAAIRAHHRSIRSVAGQIGISQQTLSLICNGVTKKTRPERLRLLSGALGVPPGWLAGTLDQLPGFEAHAWNSAKPADWQIAVSRWEQRVGEAHSRDFKNDSKKRARQFIKEGLALSLLSNLGVWRELLLLSLSGGSYEFEESPDPLDDPGFTICLTDAFLAILDPWLKGKARLNYPNLLGILGDFAELALKHLEKTDPEWATKFKAGVSVRSEAGHKPSGFRAKAKAKVSDSKLLHLGPANDEDTKKKVKTNATRKANGSR